jgi:hypothetical protein
MHRRLRFAKWAAVFTTGAFLAQFGTICNSTVTAFTAQSGFLIDDTGRLFGLLNVCGTENFQIVTNGVPGDIQNDDDDLMYGCPVTQIIVEP